MGWRGYVLPVINGDLNPSGDGLFSLNHCFFQSVTGRKAAGQVWHHDAPSGCIVSGFNGDGVAHGGVLSDTGLPPDGFDQPQPQIFLGMRHHDDAWAVWVLEDVM